jgi:spermidine synthase
MQQSFDRFSVRGRQIKNALVLGFGTGSVAHLLQKKYNMPVKIVGVENDEVVIELAKKYFSIHRYSSLSIHCQDAFDFVHQCSHSFDLLVMDVFVEVEVPSKFFQPEFIAALGKLLSPKGILFFNIVVYNEQIRTKAAQLFSDMNAHVGYTQWHKIAFSHTENWMFVVDRKQL